MENKQFPLDLQTILLEYGPYPLHRAAELGHYEPLLCLLKKGYSANQINYDCLSPLHAACNHNRLECAVLLIEHGAKVNATNIDGGTPLCEACACGSITCVELLLKHGAEINPPLSLTTPLHEACLRGSVGCTSLLIDAGARLEANDCNFGTPLHAACCMNRPGCVRKLLEAGALVNATKIHQTALHIAALNDSYEVGLVLLEYGANVYASNNQNKKPIDLLPKDDEGSFRELLLEYEVYPRSLKEYCRQRIRTHYGVNYVKRLGRYGCPSRIITYLLHL